MDFPKLLDGAKGLPDIFEIVKRAVDMDLGYARGGLMLGLADLGNHPRGFVGAFYPIATNVIVMNKVPLARIRETDPQLWRSYAFHVLLHEYLHSVGYIDEMLCRRRNSGSNSSRGSTAGTRVTSRDRGAAAERYYTEAEFPRGVGTMEAGWWKQALAEMTGGV